MFRFSSDHRISRCKIKITKRARYNNYRKYRARNPKKFIIPVHEVNSAMEIFENIWKEKGQRYEDVQTIYTDFEDTLKSILKSVGSCKVSIKTDDKLSREIATKDFIDLRTKLRNEKYC